MEDYAEDPMDVVMLAKEWVHSASLCQQPLLLLPKNYIKRLDGIQLQAHVRTDLSHRECEEHLDLNKVLCAPLKMEL